MILLVSTMGFPDCIKIRNNLGLGLNIIMFTLAGTVQGV